MKLKKIIAILLTFVLALSICACGGSDTSSGTSSDTSSDTSSKEEKSAEGKYMLYSMEDNGEVTDYNIIVMAGLGDSYIELRADKTFTMALTGEETQNGTYDIDKGEIYDDEGVGIPFKWEDDKVIITVEENSYATFVREGSELLSVTEDSSDIEDNSNIEDSSDIEDNSNDVVVDGNIYGSYVLTGEGYSEGNYSEPYTPGYVILNEGGTGVFCSNDTEMDLAWSLDGETFTGTVTMFGEMPMNGTLVNGVLEVIYGDGFYMMFEKGEIEAPDNSEGGNDAVGEDDLASLEAYAGDWHGAVYYEDCTGGYANVDGEFGEVIARIIIDENGNITPFLAIALSGGKEDNFENIQLAHYTEGDFDFMFLSGELLGMQLADDCFIERNGDSLTIYAAIDDGQGNALSIFGCLRHLDDEWDVENDYAYFPEEMYDFYYGMTLEEIAVLYGYEASDLPTA